MNLLSDFFPTAWLVIAGAGQFIVWGWCIRTAPWARLNRPAILNLWLGSAVLLMLTWSMKAAVQPGLSLHLVGATAATLMFGPQLAIICLSLALLGIAFDGAIAWASYPLNLLTMVVLPVFVADRLFRLVDRRLPNNYFIYIFIDDFLGAGLSIITLGGASTVLLALAGAYPVSQLTSEYLPFFLLLGFSEAWLTGMALTLMVVFKPEWVATFDDQRYLARK